MKSVRIRSYSGPYFPAFGLNTERYSVSLHIQSKCGKIRTRITPNTDTFYAVINLETSFVIRNNIKLENESEIGLKLGGMKLHLKYVVVKLNLCTFINMWVEIFHNIGNRRQNVEIYLYYIRTTFKHLKCYFSFIYQAIQLKVKWKSYTTPTKHKMNL